ncbi:MAG TPA: hypothetical protein VMB53_14600 [Gaiellaceae bacterium]|nr:hypothetical protein [Gaiellaceae bacterium]
MNPRRSLVTGFASATVALVIALGLRPVATERILAAYVLVLAAIVLVVLERVLRTDAAPDALWIFDRALQRTTQAPMRPPALVVTERDITLGSSNAGHFHARVLPVLREAAATRLAAHHNVDLERQPDAARRLLGDDAWEVVRPDRVEPADPYAPGVPLAQVRAVVDTLEAL